MSQIDNRNPLIERERIRGASRMITEGRDATSVTADEIQQIASDLEVFRRAQNPVISRKQIAVETGYSESVISDFLNGKYAGNKGQVAIDLDAWLTSEEEKRSKPEVAKFVPTNVVIEMQATATYCLEERTIGLIYGPETSGMGKTTGLQYIHQIIGPRQSALATFDKVDANPTGVLKKLCRSVRVQDSGTNKQRFDRLVDKMTTGGHNRKFIFLLDQIHNLRWSKDHKPFYILTDLFDATKTAQLWVGTADLVSYLTIQKSKACDESLTQINRRIFPRVDLVEALSSPTYGGTPGNPICVNIEQVREMFSRNRLKLTTAAARFICQLCNEPDSGSVGLCVQIVKYATMHAEMIRRTSIDIDLLHDALRKGLTKDRANHLLDGLDKRKSLTGDARKVG